jgi:predicted Kef-type K+ transport protein
MDVPVATDIGWILVAFLAGVGARALRLPPLVGYLAAGMGLAAVGVEAGPVVDRVGELGVALLLFLVGSTLRLQNLVQSEVVGAGGVHLLLTSALGAAGGLALGLPPWGAGAVAVSAGVSSLVLAAKGLEANGDINAYHGRVAIGIILVQTIVATAVMATLGEAPAPWALALLGVPALRPAATWALDRIESSELVVLYGLALAAGGTLAFDAVGVSGELGALAAGALVAGTDRAADVREALGPIKDAFLAAFFLGVGLIGVPTGSGLLVVAGLIGFLVVKTGLLFGVLAAFRLKARTAFLATLPLATFSGFTLIMGNAAADAGLLPSSALPILAVATAVSYLISAPLAPAAPALWRRLEPLLGPAERAGKHRDARPATLGKARFLVVGMGRAGTAAYDYLADFMQCPVGMDDDPEKLSAHREAGRRVLYGDARDASLWADLDLETVQAVILAFPGHAAKLSVIRALRQGGFDGTISALASDPDHRDDLLAAGANTVYLSIEQAGRALAAYGLKRRRDPAPGSVTLDLGARPLTPARDAAPDDTPGDATPAAEAPSGRPAGDGARQTG